MGVSFKSSPSWHLRLPSHSSSDDERGHLFQHLSPAKELGRQRGCSWPQVLSLCMQEGATQIIQIKCLNCQSKLYKQSGLKAFQSDTMEQCGNFWANLAFLKQQTNLNYSIYFKTMKKVKLSACIQWILQRWQVSVKL